MTHSGWIDQDTFNFFVPATTITKGGKGAKGDGKRWIQGIASTDSRDLQGEIVDQKGIDFSYFLKHGYLNDDHKPGADNKVGQPTECKVTKNGLWIKGFLFKNHSGADKYWELMNALAASESNRKVGFSIQGKVKRREGTKITECWIQDIALTPAPVNTTTWAEICKSLSSQWSKSMNEDDKEEDLVEDEEDEAEEVEASLSAANATSCESLDSELKHDRTSKSLTYDEAVAFLQDNHGLPHQAATAVADVVFEVF